MVPRKSLRCGWCWFLHRRVRPFAFFLISSQLIFPRFIQLRYLCDQHRIDDVGLCLRQG